MEVEIITKLILSALLSGLIGLEREIHGRAAGLRTHILVSIGACLIMITSLNLHILYGNSADPGRIAAQVVSGIGFLGAGTIIRFRASVRGLTTAASLWTVAGIGLAVGSGLYLPAIYSSLIIILTLFLLSNIERRILRRSVYRVLQIETVGEVKNLEKIRKLLLEYNAEIKDLDIKASEEEKNKYILEMSLKILEKYEPEILNDISRIEGVEFVRWL